MTGNHTRKSSRLVLSHHTQRNEKNRDAFGAPLAGRAHVVRRGTVAVRNCLPPETSYAVLQQLRPARPGPARRVVFTRPANGSRCHDSAAPDAPDLPIRSSPSVCRQAGKHRPVALARTISIGRSEVRFRAWRHLQRPVESSCRARIFGLLL
ncbi:hypothetical protein MPTK1_7g07290 [Marchantia polymorpha subsp. ruderalis]|uniref:Uncharacterized protein n=2 Tax=Marchantia polymorpha TaxID=3197 RepID=A0AAF6BX15_MARPO|nr:hypothetical protein MARPO_0076s0065 [Marchantia polymorpha]BBN16549.1 hypothetical protein Mp_7g07290 [Marchantia polymorpha subsp. ruderalis]|eukprot:PTQ34829.1 hypothetical protein MARPO_0076s0065 [Marchantia polymorpha]